jgi:excisionase family DNA binding protein
LTEPLITAREAAVVLGVATGTVLDWWEAGRLPGFRLGSSKGSPVRLPPLGARSVARGVPPRACPFTAAGKGPMIGACLIAPGSFRVRQNAHGPRASGAIAVLGGQCARRSQWVTP